MDYKRFYINAIEDKRLPTEDGYNQYFNPNVCHVCKLTDDDLISCNTCGLISYCCDEHKTLHENSHREICTIIHTGMISHGLELDKPCNSEEWIISRKQSISYIKQFITRDLKGYEIEMIMCAKSCFYCHKRTDLRTCTICYSIDYCSDHEEYFITQHTTCRTDLLLLLSINFYSMYYSTYLPFPEDKKFYKFPERKPYSDMVTFVQGYLIDYRTTTENSYFLKEYIHSDYMSMPLTLYHAYEELNMLGSLKKVKTFIVHILAASALDVTGLRVWELFQHLRRNIKELYVVMIRSETYFDSNEYTDTCWYCRKHRHCKMYFENVTVSYHDYVNTTSYKKPDVIILSLARLNLFGIWPESSKEILSQNCPILLTANSRNQIKEMEDKLKSFIATFGIYFCGENKYRGLRPYRNYETGGIIYHNYYIMMFSVLKLLESCD